MVENLIPCKPGETRNPGGRPKTKLLREHILKMFNENPEKCIKRLYAERIDLFMAYAFGKPADQLEISGADGGPIRMQDVPPLDDVQLLAICSRQ